VDGVVGPGGEVLLSLAETMAVLHATESQVRTLEVNGRLVKVPPLAGRGREPTVFYAHDQVEAVREEQLRELGAVDAVVLELLNARRAELEGLRSENERLTERLARLTNGPAGVLFRRVEELEQQNDELHRELTTVRGLHRAAVETVGSLASQLAAVASLYRDAGR
jgi:hypothetical protein